MIISVDHGNKSIKTPNTLFTSGLISSEGLQGFKTDYICWNGRYYTLTEQRISYLRDKTEDERFYVLTLFAIAKELERRKAAETLDPIDITLLIGLPPAHYEQLHSRFEQYFLRRDVLTWRWSKVLKRGSSPSTTALQANAMRSMPGSWRTAILMRSFAISLLSFLVKCNS